MAWEPPEFTAVASPPALEPPEAKEWIPPEAVDADTLSAVDEYLAASSNVTPKTSLPEFIVPSTSSGTTDVAKDFDIGGEMATGPMNASIAAKWLLEDLMTPGGGFGTGVELIPSILEPKSYEPGYEPGKIERAVNIGRTIGANMAGFFLSPGGLALTATGYGAPSVGTAIGVGFAAQGAKDIPDHYRALLAAETPQEEDAATAAAIMDALMIVGGGGITSVGGRRAMSSGQRASFVSARDTISKAETKHLQAAVADPKIVEHIGPDAKQVVVAELQRRAIARQQEAAGQSSALAAEQQARNLTESYSPATAAAVIEINQNENITQSSSRPPIASESNGQPAVQTSVSERTLDPDTGSGNQQRNAGALPETGMRAERDVAKPSSPAPESAPTPEQPPSVAGALSPEPTRTEPSPVATTAAAVPEAAKPVEQMTPEEHRMDQARRIQSVIEARDQLAMLQELGADEAAIKKAKDKVENAEIGVVDARQQDAREVIQRAIRNGKPFNAELAKLAQEAGFELPEGWTQRGNLWHPPEAKPPAPSPAPAAQAVVPKLREGQKQGDLLGGSEDLTLVGERVRSEAPKPKGPEPTVQQTINDALDAYGDLPSAWEHLDNQVKSLENNKANKAAITRLNAAKRKIENTLEEEARREETAVLDAERETQYGLLESLKDFGGLPKLSEEASGELRRITEAHRLAGRRYFRKEAKSLDTLREMYSERGFQFDDYYQMLDAIERAVASGKEQYGTSFPPDYRGGPGAMGPVEAAYQAASRKIFQSAQEPIQQRRVQEQRGDREEWLRRSDPDRMAEAEAIMEKNENAGRDLVNSINAGETKSATDIQELILVRELIDQHAKRDAAAERLADPDPTITRTEREQYQKDWDAANERIGLTEDASDRTGSEKGAAFRMRRMMVADDYSLQGLSRRERKMKGRDLTPQEVEALRKEADAIKKAQAEVDRLVEETRKQEENAVMEAVAVEMERELEAAAKTGATYHPSVMQHAKEIVERAKGEAADAWKRIRSQMGSESGAVGGVGGPKGEGKKLGQPTKQQIAAKNRATLINDVALILKARVYEFGVKMAEAAQYVLLKSGDMGDSIRPILARAVAKANTMMERELNTRPQKVKEAVKTGATAPEKQPKTKPTPESYIDKGKASVVAGDDPLYRREIGEAVDGGSVTVETHKLMSSARKLVYDIVVAHWENGVRGTDALMDAALKTVQEFLPDATLRDVHRAYGEYGKVKFPNKDALSMQLSAAYRETKLMEDIARMEKDDKDALRRGFTPAKPNLRQRELASKRAELQKLRQGEPSPEKLAGIQQARQTALKNRMEVLDKMLKTGEKPPKGRKVPDDVFTEQLKSEKQAMQDLWNEIEAAKNPPPPEHIAELARLQDRADILRDRLARMELTQPKAEGKPTVDTAEIAAAKAEIKQLSDTMAELRKPVPLSDAQKALDSALVARERAGQTLDDISTGKVKDPAKIKEALTQLEEDVRLETDALKALAAEMRRDAKPKGDPGYLKEQSQIKALERAIASYAEKVAKGDLAGKGKAQGPDSRRVAQLKAIRDSRRAAYKAARDAGKPVRSPEDRYNDTRLNAMKRREEDLKARAARQAAGDFSKRPKPVTPALRRDVLNKKAELQKMKDEIDLRQKEYELSQQPAWQKGVRALGEARGIILGGDLGVLTRQGAFAWSRPINSTVAAINATKAMFSPEAMGRWEVEMRERVIDGKPVAPIRKEHGLQTTDTMSHPEELVISRLLSRMPDIKIGGKTVKASVFFKGLERFQTTFINDVRMRTFDTGVRRGYPPDQLKLLANFINSATGRSNAKMVGPWMSAIFTSPRYERSRWEMIGQPVRNVGALVRSGAKGELNRAALSNLKDMAVTAAGAYVLFQLAESAGGYKVNWDPESSDFLKMRKGDEVWDVTAGLAPRIRDLMRIYVGFSHPDYKENWINTGGKMLSRTINPALKTPAEQLSIAKQRYEGVEEPKSPFTGFKSDEEREGLITLAPLIIQSMKQAMKEDGLDAAVWAGAREFIGSSVSRYPEPEQ